MTSNRPLVSARASPPSRHGPTVMSPWPPLAVPAPVSSITGSPPPRTVTRPSNRVAARVQTVVTLGDQRLDRHHHVVHHLADIKRLEEQADAIYHETLGNLFAGSPDPLTVMKWKDLYDSLETSIDECHYVSLALESISLKNS